MYILELDDLFGPIIDLVLLVLIGIILDIMPVELHIVVLGLRHLLQSVCTHLQSEWVLMSFQLFLLDQRMLFRCH